MYDERKKAQDCTEMDVSQEEHQSPEPRDFDFGAIVLDALKNNPDRCAFRFRGAELTRRQLRDETGQLAARLKEAGVHQGSPVVVEIEHSLELAVAMCGVQAAGACAVPIDPDVGAERRDAIMSDIGAAHVLRRATSRDKDAQIAIDIARHDPGQAGQKDTHPDLAFIVYTSGSTGGPKGVMISKESYVKRMQHVVPSVTIRDTDVDLAWTPSSFITMVDEIFLPLLVGLPTVIAEPEIRTDPRAFLKLVKQEGITTFRITPSLLNVVLRTAGAAKALAGMRTLICSGEAISAELQEMVHEQLSVTLLGFYGATEAPAVAFRAFDNDTPPVDTTICQPQPFVTLRVVDADGREVAVGETGEIWIGGCALATGYYGRPELTAEKFVERDGARWYRTGDLARRLAGNEVEILGRSDLSEVNIHGVRISLLEIREAMCALDGVSDAWVSPIDGTEGRDPVLVGHCVPRAGNDIDPEALRAELTRRLPTLAVPRQILSHAQFPLTANGKLDAQSLAREAAQSLIKSTDPAPQTAQGAIVSPTEIAVLNCFEQALGKRRIPVDENFFDFGGTSLEAVTLACLVSDHFNTEIGFEEIWLHPTARELSSFVESHGGEQSARTFFHVEGVNGPSLLAIGFGVSHLAGTWNGRRLFVSPGITGDPRISLQKHLDNYVTEYLEGLRKVQPTGPYQLIGFSFCGLLAYEVARRLQAEGEEITGIALIEPVTPLARKSNHAYGQVAARTALSSIAKRQFYKAKMMARLTKNSMNGAWNTPQQGLEPAYGHLVVAAETLRSYPGTVDLIYAEGFHAPSLARWHDVLGNNLRLHKVEAENHKALIKPECIAQWKHVIENWSA